MAVVGEDGICVVRRRRVPVPACSLHFQGGPQRRRFRRSKQRGWWQEGNQGSQGARQDEVVVESCGREGPRAGTRPNDPKEVVAMRGYRA